MIYTTTYRRLVFTVLFLSTFAADARADEGPVPNWAEVEVDENAVHVKFGWDEDPNFTKGDALEFSLMIFEDYLLPRDQQDLNPRTNYWHSINFPCPYRDIYNHTAGTQESIYRGLVDFCGYHEFTSTAMKAQNLWLAFNHFLSDDANQFAVGSMCPEEFRGGVTYEFKYYVIRDNISSSPSNTGIAWMVHDALPDNTGCPLDTGDVWGHIGDQTHWWTTPRPPFWIHRLCVPTGLYQWSPFELQDQLQQDNRSVCADCDGDGMFAQQNEIMHGTNIGDQYDYGYDPSSKECLSFYCPPGDFCESNIDCAGDKYCDPYCNICFMCQVSENICHDNVDEDCDGMSDCEDPDCINTQTCTSPQDPCSTVTSGSGYYCGDDSEMLDGNPGELYYCVNQSSTQPPPGCPSIGPCPGDCTPSDPGDHACCEGNCNGLPCVQGTYRCSSSSDVEACAVDGCSFQFSHTCPFGETCISGTCTSQCNNGILEAGEECDGGNLGGATCQSLGYLGGSLSCTSGCSYDTSGCCECSTGDCCDGCYFRSSTVVCDTWTEQRCEGSNPGDDVEESTFSQHCSGLSSTCSGSVTTSSWVDVVYCSSSEYCHEVGTSASCNSCPGNYIFSTTRSCGPTYCIEIVSADNTTTSVRFSKTDTTAFGNWLVWWNVYSDGVKVDETIGFCGDYSGLFYIPSDFPTGNLSLTDGSTVSISGRLWVGPNSAPCSIQKDTGSTNLTYFCQ